MKRMTEFKAFIPGHCNKSFMSKIIRTVFIVLAFTTTGIIIQSCCEQSYRITPEGEMVSYFVESDSSYTQTDIIRGEFVLEAQFQQEFISTNKSASFNAAYATTCNDIYINSLDPGSFALTLDKPFVFMDDTISTTDN